MAEPFDTAALRRRVLPVWADSPARFCEDAIAEEDLVRRRARPDQHPPLEPRETS